MDFFERAKAFFPRSKDWPPENQRKVMTFEEFKEFSSRPKKTIENNNPKKGSIEEGGGDPAPGS